jgi:regulator-associated protein of mTOR
MKRVNSSNSLCNYPTNIASVISTSTIPNVYWTVWKAITAYCNDPYPEVAIMAQTVIDEMKSRASQSLMANDSLKESISEQSLSEPASPNNNQLYMSESPTSNIVTSRNTTPVRDTLTTSSRANMSSPFPHPQQYSAFITPYSRKRTIFGREPSVSDKSQDGNADELSVCQREPLISTSFVEWCTKHFSQPNAPNICYTEDIDPESPSHYEKEWRTARNREIEMESKKELFIVDPSRIDGQLFHQKNANTPQRLAFHPYENRLIVGERETFSVWGFESQTNNCNNYVNPVLFGTHNNLNLSPSRITDIQLLNTNDNTLLMTGCDDGSIRIWRNFGINGRNESPEMVTAFHIFNDIQSSSKSSGVILSWNQSEQNLIATGEPRVIRLWDARKEMKIRDLTTGADTCVTSISTDNSHLICVGCGDGSVRVFDDRLMPHDSRVFTFYEHKSWIINAHIYPDHQKHVHIISGSLTGDIKWFDKRLPTSVKSISTGLGMTAMSVHPEADVFAWYQI